MDGIYDLSFPPFPHLKWNSLTTVQDSVFLVYIHCLSVLVVVCVRYWLWLAILFCGGVSGYRYLKRYEPQAEQRKWEEKEAREKARVVIVEETCKRLMLWMDGEGVPRVGSGDGVGSCPFCGSPRLGGKEQAEAEAEVEVGEGDVIAR